MSDLTTEELHKKQDEITAQLAARRQAKAEEARIDAAAEDKAQAKLEGAKELLIELENDSYKENKRLEDERHAKALAAIERAFSRPDESDVPPAFRNTD